MSRLLSCETKAPVVHCYHKGALFVRKQIALGIMIGITALLMCCVPAWTERAETLPEPIEMEASGEGASSEVAFTLYAADRTAYTELFYAASESAHAIAYVSAHAISGEAAQALLDGFEETVYPALPLQTAQAPQRVQILISHMEGQIRGYTLFPELQQSPAICLNALYPEDLSYALAHEYQHLCAYEACQTGGTTLSEETDELLSDMFCEQLYPHQGQERSILSEQRANRALDRIEVWGPDAVLHVHDLLREGYTEEEIMSTLENR